jgi:hypothetical protein
MQLFDIIKLIFNNKQKEWKSVGKIDKSRNFFMINRIMSIQFPVQANQFNKLKVVPAPVVDWWHDTLSARFSKPPVWLYTKTKKSDGPKTDEVKTSELTESFIRDKYRISKRDIETIKKFYPDKYSSWVSDISDQAGLQK